MKKYHSVRTYILCTCRCLTFKPYKQKSNIHKEWLQGKPLICFWIVTAALTLFWSSCFSNINLFACFLARKPRINDWTIIADFRRFKYLSRSSFNNLQLRTHNWILVAAKFLFKNLEIFSRSNMVTISTKKINLFFLIILLKNLVITRALSVCSAMILSSSRFLDTRIWNARHAIWIVRAALKIE